MQFLDVIVVRLLCCASDRVNNRTYNVGRKMTIYFLQSIMGALRHATKGRTSICIAHRLSTVIDADEILVLEEGQVAEAGTHEELLARNGYYARLWNSQHHIQSTV